jgi:hypothetical protein
VLRHQGQHLVAVLARVGQELPEFKVVGLLHGSHLVHLQRLLQRVQEGLVLLTHHKSEFLVFSFVSIKVKMKFWMTLGSKKSVILFFSAILAAPAMTKII